MKLLPGRSKSGVRRMGGSAPLRKGMAASFLLIAAGFAGALLYTFAFGRGTVFLSLFFACWIALSCCGGGFLAGLRGGAGAWWPSGQIGVLGGSLVLVLLALLAPESLGPGDLLTYGLLPASLSCAGALAGANWQLRSTRSLSVKIRQDS